MEKISVKKEVVEERWQTVDGMTWVDKDRAKQWENKLECIALKQIENRMKNVKDTNQGYYKVSWMAGFDNDVNIKLFRPETEGDIKNFLMYCELSNKNIFKYCQDTTKKLKIGETYVIFDDYEYDGLSIFSKESFNEFIKERTEIFNNIFKEMDKEE